jgi:HK97 family phage major capsid protein
VPQQHLHRTQVPSTAVGAAGESVTQSVHYEALGEHVHDQVADVMRRQPYAIQVEQRAFSTVDSLLPPSLQPVIVGPQYENRLLNRLPIVLTEAPSIEYVRHTSTTGTPALVAEVAVKPDLVMVTDKVILPMQKLAAHTGISWESLTDYPAFQEYVTGEVFREVVNVENNELLNGDGTAGHLTGILHTSGILTHATGPRLAWIPLNRRLRCCAMVPPSRNPTLPSCRPPRGRRSGAPRIRRTGTW